MYFSKMVDFRPHPKPGKREKKRSHGSDPGYKKWLKGQLCSNPNCPGQCGDIVPAHQSCLGTSGMGMTANDRHALPLGCICHNKEHGGHVSFWGQGTKAQTKIFVRNLCNEHIDRYLVECC